MSLLDIIGTTVGATNPTFAMGVQAAKAIADAIETIQEARQADLITNEELLARMDTLDRKAERLMQRGQNPHRAGGQ